MRTRAQFGRRKMKMLISMPQLADVLVVYGDRTSESTRCFEQTCFKNAEVGWQSEREIVATLQAEMPRPLALELHHALSPAPARVTPNRGTTARDESLSTLVASSTMSPTSIMASASISPFAHALMSVST